MAVVETKACVACGEVKGRDEYHPTPTGLRAKCRACWNAATAAYRASRREQYAAYMREKRASDPFRYKQNLRKLGVTKEWWDSQVILQGGVCPGCGEMLGDGVNVDHDHATGVLRGLLCGPCNRALGQARDSADTLRRLADYLDATKGK